MKTSDPCQSSKKKIAWLLFLTFIFIPQAVLFFLLVGASRFSALTINFIYFIFLQIKHNLEISKMYAAIGDYVAKSKWNHAEFSTNLILDALASGDLVDLYYKKKRILLNSNMSPLGGSLYAISPSETKTTLEKNTDILVLGSQTLGSPVYPFNQSTIPLRSLLKTYAKNHFLLLGRYPYGDHYIYAYVKKSKTVGP